MYLSCCNITPPPCTTIVDPTKGATSERWGDGVDVISQNVIILPKPN